MSRYIMTEEKDHSVFVMQDGIEEEDESPVQIGDEVTQNRRTGVVASIQPAGSTPDGKPMIRMTVVWTDEN